MNKDVNFLLNDYFKILNIIYNNQITINDETYCNLSQNEIAILNGTARATVNIALNKLKDMDLIQYDIKQQKKYYLTQRALDILNIINRI